MLGHVPHTAVISQLALNFMLMFDIQIFCVQNKHIFGKQIGFRAQLQLGCGYVVAQTFIRGFRMVPMPMLRGFLLWFSVILGCICWLPTGSGQRAAVLFTYSYPMNYSTTNCSTVSFLKD